MQQVHLSLSSHRRLFCSFCLNLTFLSSFSLSTHTSAVYFQSQQLSESVNHFERQPTLAVEKLGQNGGINSDLRGELALAALDLADVLPQLLGNGLLLSHHVPLSPR